MSGRIRTIKPEWLEDEVLGREPDHVRLLSVAIVLIADDYGRGRAASEYIAGATWVYDRSPESLRKSTEALRRLSEVRFITLYQVDGQAYFEIRNWSKHQRVHNPGKPRIPAPSESLGIPRETLGRTSESLPPDLRSPITDHPLCPVAQVTDEPGEVQPDSAGHEPIVPSTEPAQGEALLGEPRPTPPQDTQGAVKAKPESKATKGTRAPSSVDEDAPAWLAKHKLPALDSDQGAEVAEFLDYWTAVGGAKGCKTNWAATWRNSLRMKSGRRPGKAAPPAPTPQTGLGFSKAAGERAVEDARRMARGEPALSGGMW